MISISERRPGFALPAVLTVTGVVTLVFVVAITALASLTAEAASARARIGFLQRALTLEATLAHLAATEPFTPRAISVGFPRNYDEQFGTAPLGGFTSTAAPSAILLDGETYTADLGGPMTVSLRDQAGMVNLPQMNRDQLSRVGARLGIPPSERDRLRARLTDYVDSNSLETTDGAEQAAYARSGPANRPLLRPSEWLSVLGVRSSISPSAWRILRPELAADQTQGTYNINTASPVALEILFNLTPEQAARALQSRNRAPFTSITSLGAATGAPLSDDGETLYTFPSGRFVFTVSDGRSPWVYRGRLTITPGDAERPIWLDQTEITESPGRRVADTTNATAFPYTPR
jgi:type II secretory pathway component PulK